LKASERGSTKIRSEIFRLAVTDGIAERTPNSALRQGADHQLRCGKNALADERVNRANANAEPDRGRISTDCLQVCFSIQSPGM
jgi:hypothetical protein